MDCRTALALLDCARHDSLDICESELVGALEHVESCAHCLAIVRKRQSLDRRISTSMQNVSLPNGLEERLLELLPREGGFSDANSVKPAAVGAPARRTTSRRRSVQFVAAASIMLVVGAALWGYFVLTAPTLTLDAIVAELSSIESQDWSELRAFNGDESLTSLPSEAWENGPIWVERNPRGLPRGAAHHTMALFSFRTNRLVRGESTRGLVIVVARRMLAGPPDADGMIGAPIYYATAGGSGYTLKAWTAGELVYVCGVEGGADNLESLQRLLDGPSA